MDIRILAKFCEEFKEKDINYKFNLLKAYKKVYKIKPNENKDKEVTWLYQ
ncbi:hypothetical protein [Romboutsia lituseburensis]|nr:hypothetical protein [Romboutsia lituseburensis]MCR8744365.1 hypothetical protein [Romboutsia lituseburensis]